MKTQRITDIMADFLDSIREYEHESGEAIHFDERESYEFVDMYFNNEGKLKTEKKEPLFIAKDGAVFFDDFYYLVTKPYFVKTKLKAKENIYKGDGFIYFKHEFNADEYIWKNKPVFSYEDFMRWGNVPYERVIKKLAKERIEQ